MLVSEHVQIALEHVQYVFEYAQFAYEHAQLVSEHAQFASEHSQFVQIVFGGCRLLKGELFISRHTAYVRSLVLTSAVFLTQKEFFGCPLYMTWMMFV